MKVRGYSRVLLLLGAMVFVVSTALADKIPTPDSGKWSPREMWSALADVPEVEPNDDPATATPFACGDALRPAAISPPGDVDFIEFTASVGTIIEFGTDADGAAPVPDTFIELRADDGTTVLAFNDDGGPGFYSALSYNATYTGTYYGFIRAFSATQEGGYVAFVNCSEPPPECDLTDYKDFSETFATPIPIPDGDPNGILAGQIIVPNGLEVMNDVVVALNIDHTFLGDLIVTVTYDKDCDGTDDASATILCRPGRGSCDGAIGTDFGCSSNLSCDSPIFVSDAGAAALGTSPGGCGVSADVLPTACYLPSENAEALANLAGQQKGGCFKLFVSDNAAFDTGSICGWSVWTDNEPAVPVEEITWGTVKTLYE